MNRWMKMLIVPFLVLFLCGGAWALSLGTDITISDLNYSGNDWWSDKEDQEVEPDMQIGQQWDLEGFYLDGSTLSMVGGYNFASTTGWVSGDIFIGRTKNVKYGPAAATSTTVNTDGTPITSNGNHTVYNTYGYDYVIDLDFANSQYIVREISSDTELLTSYYLNYGTGISNQASNPWRYEDGSTSPPVLTGSIDDTNYFTGLGDADVGGLMGGDHNVLQIDLSFLAPDTDFTVHYTMQCGNDNLMGTTSVPEPSTMLLFGTGLVSLVGVSRKKFVR